MTGLQPIATVGAPYPSEWHAVEVRSREDLKVQLALEDDLR